MNLDNIVLVGMAGTGKTTIGRALAARLGFRFVDSDERIVEREGRLISTLFAEHGETYFRGVESAVIEELLQSKGQVIATGGGAVLAERNRAAMLHGGFVVALLATAETIIARVTGDTSRPLFKGNPTVEVPLLMEKRKHAYDFAPVRIRTDGQTVEQIVEEICRKRTEAAE